MSAPAPPTVPPRPVRAQQAAEAGASQLPEIPPRPKRLDRSISPGNYPRSPLNEPFDAKLGRLRSNEPSSLNPRLLPPNVQMLPSIGQEGNEYADIQFNPAVPSSGLGADDATQTRNVAEDLHLHAPKPSLPKSSATAQVQAVTKTDSQHSGSPRYAKPPTPSHEEFDPLNRVKTKPSFSRPDSQASTERRRSIAYGDEHGPAELGMRVPINPLLGDVQAPSPAPFGSALTPTHTGHNGDKRRHTRTKSGREVFLPPGSYGLHGHGVTSQDKFEKDWYAKHPDQLQQEEGFGHGVYESIGSGRGNFAMSSDDLNKIVHDTASRSAGFGTSGNTMSYPDEQIGYMASEQYASRSQVTSPNNLIKMHSNLSHPAVESPLRKASFPAEEEDRPSFNRTRDSPFGKSENAAEGETVEPFHLDEPSARYNKVTGGEGSIRETEEVLPYIRHPTEEGRLADEHGYTVPILASDEAAKEASADFMHPAVPPKQDRRGSHYEYEPRGSGDVTPSSRPTSRPASIHGMHSLSHSLSRFVSHHEGDRDSMHTPLEDVDEYEPLFPDDDDKKAASTTADRFKRRPENLRHRFPSQDIWEDTPSSAMYEATVSTPDLPSQYDQSKELGAASTFEHPDTEASRKGEPSEEEKKKLVPAEERLAKSRFAPHLRDDMLARPGMQHRFPSQDIWEDSPDSQYLVTTVSSPPIEDDNRNPYEESTKPIVPPRPATKSKLSEDMSPPTPPSVPARPAKLAVRPANAKLNEVVIPPVQSTTKEPSPTEIRKVPSIPDRPKPQIPPRPAQKTSVEGLSKTVSSTSAGSAASAEAEKVTSVTSPPVAKVKPQIPARPAQSGKFAALKGNFMNDLNQKLGLGPPKEKEKAPEPEVEQEAKPLEDARKGRARGPQRRAPAKSPSATTDTPKTAQHAIFAPKSLWHIGSDDGLLNVHPHEYPAAESQAAAAMAEESAINPPVEISEETIAQMDHSTIADASPAPVIDTTESKLEEGFTSNPEAVSTSMAPEGLAKNTAGESADPSPPTPKSEKINPIDRLMQESGEGSSLSQHTTAESAASGTTLERVQSVTEAQKVVTGADRLREPSGEEDVNYKKLEEMTAMADGKEHAPEEAGTEGD